MNMKATSQSTGEMAIGEVMQRDLEFRYLLLGRLQADCQYYLGYGNRNTKRLWAGNETKQIELMIKLYNSFREDEKPTWITMDEIMEYSQEMTTKMKIETTTSCFIVV